MRGGFGRPFLFVRLVGAANAVLLAALLASSITPERAVAGDTGELILDSLKANGLGRDALYVIDNEVNASGKSMPQGLFPGQTSIWRSPLSLLDDPAGVVVRNLAVQRWNVAGLSDPPSVRGATTPKAALRRFTMSARLPIVRWRRALSRLAPKRAEVVSALSTGEIPFHAARNGLSAGLAEATRDLGPSFLTLLSQLRIASGPLALPSEIDHVVGTTGDDRHVLRGGHEILVLEDPGGDDTYDFGALREGSVVIIIDSQGNDTYRGPGGVLTALLVVDRTGNDRWITRGGGPGAALGGVAITADLAGDDTYEGDHFGQAAAVLGRALLLDASGDDRYVLASLGQAFAGAGGAAALLDLAGDDTYLARGDADPLGRGGAVSKAQGVGFGERRGTAGGIAALIDVGGNDSYSAELFAQGHGFFHGIGLLEDRGGNDRYDAVRYAQGSGAHFGFGALVDHDGDDVYTAAVGVGQGMGLDRAVGVLLDRGGNDSYLAASLAQGASTANGIGLLDDGAGRNSFALGSRGWGETHWSGGLPGIAALVGVDARDRLRYGETPFDGATAHPLGPRSHEDPNVERPIDVACPAPVATAAAADVGAALESAAPMVGSGPPAIRAHWIVRRALGSDLEVVIDSVGRNELRALGFFGVLHCHLQEATTAARIDAVTTLSGALKGGAIDQVWPVAGALVRADLAGTDREGVVANLIRQESCPGIVAAVEIARLEARRGAALAPAFEAWVLHRALASPCWRGRAAALRLADAGSAVRVVRRPSFLADPVMRAVAFPQP